MSKRGSPQPSNMLNQTRVTMPPVVLNYDLANLRRATRADIMIIGAPTVTGHDSTDAKQVLPEEWTLVKETNMESRQSQKVNYDDPQKKGRFPSVDLKFQVRIHT